MQFNIKDKKIKTYTKVSLANNSALEENAQHHFQYIVKLHKWYGSKVGALYENNYYFFSCLQCGIYATIII